MEEFLRRAADQRAIDAAPSTKANGRSAATIRALIAHYTAMLDLIERYELGVVGALVLCQCCLHGGDLAHRALHISPFS